MADIASEVLRRLSIRHRLLALSALGVVLTMSVGLVAVLALSRAADLANQIAHHANLHELAARVRADALTLRRYEKDLLLGAKSPARIAEYRREFVKSDDALRKVLLEIEGQVSTDDDRAAVTAIRMHLDAYDLAVAGVYERLQKNQVDLEREGFASTDSAEEEMRGIEAASELLVTRARERQWACGAELHRLGNQLAILLGVATSVLALVAMIAGSSVNRSIARPLIETLNVLEAVAAGDLDQRAELGHIDEMGRIATSLNTAIQRMKHDREEIERLAAIDPLTGLMNRRAFTDRVAQEVSRSRRYGYPFALLLFDIDHFKRINDKHGHAIGDLVLARIGKLVNEQIRTSDFAGRWGGEEFVVALPHVGLDGAAVAAARIRIATEELKISDKGRHVATTVSIGVAELRANDTLRSLIERADHGMYAAKRQGRNRVIVNDGSLLSMPPARTSGVPPDTRVG